MNRKVLQAAALLFLVFAVAAFADGGMDKAERFFQAVRMGDTGYVKNALDSQDVDINIENSDGWTALMVAVDASKVEMVLLLLTYNPSLNVEDPNGETALSLAEKKGNGVITQAIRTAKP